MNYPGSFVLVSSSFLFFCSPGFVIVFNQNGIYSCFFGRVAVIYSRLKPFWSTSSSLRFSRKVRSDDMRIEWFGVILTSLPSNQDFIVNVLLMK